MWVWVQWVKKEEGEAVGVLRGQVLVGEVEEVKRVGEKKKDME